MEVEWFELLPEQCPPEDAQQCDGYYYRIANGNPAQSVDFFSQRRLQPDKVFKGLGVDECITRAVSLLLCSSILRKLTIVPIMAHSQTNPNNPHPQAPSFRSAISVTGE